MKSCVIFSRKELYGGLLTSKEIISIYVLFNLLSRHSLLRFCIRGAPVRVGKRGKQTTTKIAYNHIFSGREQFFTTNLKDLAIIRVQVEDITKFPDEGGPDGGEVLPFRVLAVGG